MPASRFLRPAAEPPLTRDEIEAWLRETDAQRLEMLWEAADGTRSSCVGDEVHLRGLIEISNHCVRQCAYCGLRAANERLRRYRMTAEEIAECAVAGRDFGYGTIVLQSGEDYGIETTWLAGVVRRIKNDLGLAVTLSLGERSAADLSAWREAGADRYLLRFETSDQDLYHRIHPELPGRRSDRLAILHTLRELGYEIGSGIMVGIPGQTYASVARDIAVFRELDLDMIGVGPYVAHPATPLGDGSWNPRIDHRSQVPGDEFTVYKVIALTRLACPQANIPSTTALATLNRDQGRELGLQRGANVVMPNLTLPAYRVMYEIYPDKACVAESAGACRDCLRDRVQSIGRRLGSGPGGRRRSVAAGD